MQFKTYIHVEILYENVLLNLYHIFLALLKKLIEINERLGEIQRALEVYMDTKRHVFPRFYFISNDDLLDILVNANEPELLQPHFKKCFDNINKLKFEVSIQKVKFNCIISYYLYYKESERR